jgi:hypothetical protein
MQFLGDFGHADLALAPRLGQALAAPAPALARLVAYLLVLLIANG